MLDTQHLVPAMLYSVALLPPARVSEPLAAIRARLDPEHAPKTTPHITLKQPFATETNALNEAALVRALSRACARHPSFQLELEGVSFFESPRFGCVLYIGARACPQLHALSAALVHAIAELGHKTLGLELEHENRLFFPHLTLAQGLGRQEAEHAQRELSELGSYAFSAERVVVGRCGPDGVWERPYELGLDRSQHSLDLH